MEGRPEQPVFQQHGETSGSGQSESAIYLARGLMQPGLHVGSISEYCTMWSDLALLARRTQQPEAVRRTIRNIGLGLDYLASTQRYEQISEGHKTFIREDAPVMLKNEGIDRVVLSYEDAKLLQLAAAAVNIAYDPGEPESTSENIKKRTFNFAELEGMPSTNGVIDAEQ